MGPNAAPAMPALVQRLHREVEPCMYWSIVTALAEIGAAALPGFIAGAQHGDASIRQFSVQRIEQFGERAVQQAVEQLASALGSDNIYTSVRAATGLRSLQRYGTFAVPMASDALDNLNVATNTPSVKN
jgi:hypothetical protein